MVHRINTLLSPTALPWQTIASEDHIPVVLVDLFNNTDRASSTHIQTLRDGEGHCLFNQA
eukprot:160138-Amphidinium_carterae.2